MGEKFLEKKGELKFHSFLLRFIIVRMCENMQKKEKLPNR